ncbi:MAG: hypothetical protein Q7T55_19390 [Solirubrobacteraceae bacterium]|nr:hypothetical protein [Solirubrobacteraceae bacterium]
MSAGAQQGPRSAARRSAWPVALVVLGLLLVITTVGGYAWELAAELRRECPLTGLCISGGFPPEETVRLGHAGLVAAVLGWAAFARTPIRAALRVPVALVVLPVVFGLLIYGGAELISAIREASREDEFKPVNEFSVQPSLAIDPLALLVVVGCLVGSALSGLLSRASVDRSGGLRRWPAGLLLAGFAAEAVRTLAIGAEVASAVTVVSALWLLAVLRLASRRAATGQGASESDPSLATA